MNIHTGHIVQNVADIDEVLRHRYVSLHNAEAAAASRVLDGRRETYIGRRAGSADERALRAFAKKERAKRRRRTKIAKASRRRNRHT